MSESDTDERRTYARELRAHLRAHGLLGPQRTRALVRMWLGTEGWNKTQRRFGGRWYVAAPEGWRFVGLEDDLYRKVMETLQRS
jgi:hypothetical protein